MTVLLNQQVVVLGLSGTRVPSTMDEWARVKLKVSRSVYWFASWRLRGRLEKLGAKGLAVEEML